MPFTPPVFYSLTPLVETLETLSPDLIDKMIKTKHQVEYRKLTIIYVALSPRKCDLWMLCKLKKDSTSRYAILRNKNSRSYITFIISARFIWAKIKSYFPK